MNDRHLRDAPRPLYFPDLAPSDFLIFGQVNRALEGSELESADEVLDVVPGISDDILDILLTTFHDCTDR
jgi:hypothetical protein